jgi:hypothetical protein
MPSTVYKTWLEKSYVQNIKHGMTIIHHDPEVQRISRCSGGVAIILSGPAIRDWKHKIEQQIQGVTQAVRKACITRFKPMHGWIKQE